MLSDQGDEVALLLLLRGGLQGREKTGQISEGDEGRVPLPGRQDVLSRPRHRLYGGGSLRRRVRGRRHRARHQGGVHSHAEARRPRGGNQAGGPEDPRKGQNPEKKEPAGPPEPWETHETHDGNTYYWNRLTGETSWTLPEAPKLKAAAAPPPKKPKKKRSWCFGRRKPATKTLVVAAEHHSHSTFEHPEAAARDDFEFPARLSSSEFPAPLKDDMVVEDLEDDYPLENHMDELHGPLVVND